MKTMISARFCDGTKQRPADLERGRTSKRENPGNEVGYISDRFLCHSLVQCKQVFILYWIDFHVSMKNSPLQCRNGQEILFTDRS